MRGKNSTALHVKNIYVTSTEIKAGIHFAMYVVKKLIGDKDTEGRKKMPKCKNCNNLYNLSNKDDVIVGKWCPKINDSPHLDMERNCEHYKAMTNADRIRSMTDEELAKWFDTVTKDILGGSTWDKKGWLKWLRAESEG